jgi:hypothetical protein
MDLVGPERYHACIPPPHANQKQGRQLHRQISKKGGGGRRPNEVNKVDSCPTLRGRRRSTKLLSAGAVANSESTCMKLLF